MRDDGLRTRSKIGFTYKLEPSKVKKKKKKKKKKLFQVERNWWVFREIGRGDKGNRASDETKSEGVVFAEGTVFHDITTPSSKL